VLFSSQLNDRGPFPCRSSGACIDLLAQVYRQVAPNGALNPLTCGAFQQSSMGSIVALFQCLRLRPLIMSRCPSGTSNVRPDGMLMSSDLNESMKECGMESRSLLGTAMPPLHYFPRARKLDRRPTIVPRCEHFILFFAPIARIFYVHRMSWTDVRSHSIFVIMTFRTRSTFAVPVFCIS